MADQFSSNRDFYEAMLEEKRRREEEEQNAVNPPGTEELEDPTAFDVSEEGEEARRVQEQNFVEKEKIVSDPPEEAVPVVEERPPAPKETVEAVERGPAEEKTQKLEDTENYIERPLAEVKATAKEEANQYLDYFAGQFAFETRTDGTNFLRDEILLVEDDKDEAVRKMAPNEQHRLYRSMLEEKSMLTAYDVNPNTGKKTLLDEFKEVPEEVWRGVFLRNIKSLEDFANELSGDRYTFDFAPEFEDEESVVADVAEMVPLIAASFTPAGLVARGLQASRWGMRLYKVASTALPRHLLPNGLKMISSAATFSAFQAMKAAVRRDEQGRPIAPDNPYGALASIFIDETPEQAKARIQAYRQGDLWERFMTQAKGVTVDEIFLEAGVLGAGALAFKGARAATPLLKKGGSELMGRLEKALDPVLRKTDFQRGVKLKAIKEHRRIRDFEALAKVEKAEFQRMVANDELPEEALDGYLNWVAKQQYQKNIDFLNSYQEWTMLQNTGRKRIKDGNRVIEVYEHPKPLIPEKPVKAAKAVKGKKGKAVKKDIVKPKKQTLEQIEGRIAKLSGAARVHKTRLREATDEYMALLSDPKTPRTQLTAAMRAMGKESRNSSVEILRLQSTLTEGAAKGTTKGAAKDTAKGTAKDTAKGDALTKKKIARLKNKKKALDDLYKKTKLHVKASPDVIEEQEALERLLSHEELGQTAERLKKIPGRDRDEIFKLMDGLANGEIAPGDVKIYQAISQGMSFAKVADIYQKTVIGGMLLVTALEKAVIGNATETSVRKGIGAGKLGFTTAAGRTMRGLSNVARLGAARGRSKEYITQSLETMRGVRTAQAYTERTLPYSGVQPMATGAVEQGLNAVPGAVFKALEVLDEVSTAFNSPEIVEGVLFDLAARRSHRGLATKFSAQREAGRLAQEIGEKLARGNKKDPLVKEFLELSDEEAKRIAFRADVTKDPDAYKWVQKTSEFIRGAAAKKMDDKWYATLGKTFFQTTVFPFANTGVNIAYRTAETFHGLALLAGQPLRKRGLTAAERSRMLDGTTRAAIGFSLLTYAMNADDPVFDIRLPEPGEDSRTLRNMGSTVLGPTDVQLAGGTIDRNAFGPLAPIMVLQASMVQMARTASKGGDDSLWPMAINAIANVFHSMIPAQSFENIANLAHALDTSQPKAGQRLGEDLLKTAVQKGTPGLAMARRIREGRTEGVYSKHGVPERPSEGLFTGDAFDVLVNVYEHMRAQIVSAFGKDGDFEYDLLGLQVSNFFSEVKDDAWKTFVPVSRKAAPSKENLAKYQNLTNFMSEMGMLGDSTADTDEDHPLGAQQMANPLRLKLPSTSVTVRKKTVRAKQGKKFIDDSETASVALAPQHQNFMRSLVGTRDDRLDELQDMIADDKENAEENLEAFLELRTDLYDLWEEWGGTRGKDGLADLMAKIHGASAEELEKINSEEAHEAWEELVYLGRDPNLPSNLSFDSVSEENLKLVKAHVIATLYNDAHKLAKEMMGLHPEYQDDSPALKAFRKEKEEESRKVQNPAI